MCYVSFINGGDYIVVASFESERVNEKREDVKRIVYYYKAPPYPYIEMLNADNDYGNLSLDGQYYMVPYEADLNTDFWFHYAQAVKTTDGDLVAEFPMSGGLTADASYTSPDKEFFATYQGVFNAHNDLLITLDLDFIDNSGVNLSFSKDSKFLKVSYLDGLQRIFALDPANVIDVYGGDTANVSLGINALNKILTLNQTRQYADTIRYTIGLFHIEKKELWVTNR